MMYLIDTYTSLVPNLILIESVKVLLGHIRRVDKPREIWTEKIRIFVVDFLQKIETVHLQAARSDVVPDMCGLWVQN